MSELFDGTGFDGDPFGQLSCSSDDFLAYRSPDIWAAVGQQQSQALGNLLPDPAVSLHSDGLTADQQQSLSPGLPDDLLHLPGADLPAGEELLQPSGPAAAALAAAVTQPPASAAAAAADSLSNISPPLGVGEQLPAPAGLHALLAPQLQQAGPVEQQPRSQPADMQGLLLHQGSGSVMQQAAASATMIASSSLAAPCSIPRTSPGEAAALSGPACAPLGAAAGQQHDAAGSGLGAGSLQAPGLEHMKSFIAQQVTAELSQLLPQLPAGQGQPADAAHSSMPAGQLLSGPGLGTAHSALPISSTLDTLLQPTVQQQQQQQPLYGRPISMRPATAALVLPTGWCHLGSAQGPLSSAGQASYQLCLTPAAPAAGGVAACSTGAQLNSSVLPAPLWPQAAAADTLAPPAMPIIAVPQAAAAVRTSDVPSLEHAAQAAAEPALMPVPAVPYLPTDHLELQRLLQAHYALPNILAAHAQHDRHANGMSSDAAARLAELQARLAQLQASLPLYSSAGSKGISLSQDELLWTAYVLLHIAGSRELSNQLTDDSAAMLAQEQQTQQDAQPGPRQASQQVQQVLALPAPPAGVSAGKQTKLAMPGYQYYTNDSNTIIIHHPELLQAMGCCLVCTTSDRCEQRPRDHCYRVEHRVGCRQHFRRKEYVLRLGQLQAPAAGEAGWEKVVKKSRAKKQPVEATVVWVNSSHPAAFLGGPLLEPELQPAAPVAQQELQQGQALGLDAAHGITTAGATATGAAGPISTAHMQVVSVAGPQLTAAPAAAPAVVVPAAGATQHAQALPSGLLPAAPPPPPSLSSPAATARQAAQHSAPARRPAKRRQVEPATSPTAAPAAPNHHAQQMIQQPVPSGTAAAPHTWDLLQAALQKAVGAARDSGLQQHLSSPAACLLHAVITKAGPCPPPDSWRHLPLPDLLRLQFPHGRGVLAQLLMPPDVKFAQHAVESNSRPQEAWSSVALQLLQGLAYWVEEQAGEESAQVWKQKLVAARSDTNDTALHICGRCVGGQV